MSDSASDPNSAGREMRGWVKRILNNLAAPVVIAALVAGVFGVYQLSEAERERLEWDQHIRKAEVYREILKSVNGFFENASDARKKKNEVLDALRLCELHCPDEVFRAGNAFVASVAEGAGTSYQERRRALAAFRLALRRDLNPETGLSIKEFRNWTIIR